MTAYPLILRHRTAYFYRAFMLFYVIGVGLLTLSALNYPTPGPEKWWPYIVVLFWLAGVAGLIWSLNQETALVRITGPGNIYVRRGKAFRPIELWIDKALFRIEDTEDHDGDPYYKLMMDAPGGPLTIAAENSRPRLEELKQHVEIAIRG